MVDEVTEDIIAEDSPELRHIPGNGNQILSIETHQNGKESAYAYAARLNLENLELKAEIAARVSTEQERNRLIKELVRSNRELREFASVAAHDLQAPLRKMRTFANLLAEDYGSSLKDEGLAYIRRMIDAANRMRHLIDGLLSYSCLDGEKPHFERVDLGNLIREVVSNMEMPMEQGGGLVEVNVDMVIDADPLQMGQLFQNLIHNALKFRRDDPPVVNISGIFQRNQTDSAGETGVHMAEIRVQDNGIGFDETNMDRVFAPFQRLHPVHEYKGSGMGLPICKKIVERHNGTLSAKSEKGKGTVFTVRLPVTEEVEEMMKPTGNE